MRTDLRRHLTIAAAALFALGWAVSARAAERVTLSNGFVESCDHHAEVDGRVRLYLTASNDNYIELRPEQVAAVAFVPNAPTTPQAAQISSSARGKLSATDLEQMLSRAGRQHNLDVDLLASVVKAESGGNARAVSRAGAEGLMQLMPSTAASMGVRDRFEPGENIQGGSAYLDSLLTRYHDNLALALAAYNAGPQAVDRYHGIPPYAETRAYVARVIHEFNRRVRARQAAARSSAGNQRASR
ncbi:MAG: lytic transglycosylase domain-containing protein [Acidobacteriota bacterium]